MGDSESEDPVADLVARVRAAKQAKLPPARSRKRIRETAGVSARDVARVLGVNVMSVLRWEDGKATPTPEHAIAYRRLLDALEEAVAS
jgi:DNA-binding transcriptional regulator YiaG